jgi:glutathione synthase/RimK-type ligase-like ATP-grasp enzyme
MHTVLVGSPGDVRVVSFQRALAALRLPPARVVSYPELIAERVQLQAVVAPGSVVRIESPGKDAAANEALLQLGALEPDEEGTYTQLRDNVPFAKGHLLPFRQWYLGFRALMRQITVQLSACPPHTLFNHPDDILVMFDKRACHARLHRLGIPVPPALSPVRNFAELEVAMFNTGLQRVFVKPAHGSSASGVVAYQTNGRQRQATAAVEMVQKGGETRLYNTRQIQIYRDDAEIARLLDTLCADRVHVERWIPKATWNGQCFDLRVVVIGGQAAHTVARLSRGPMTNLHLLNQRRDREAVLQRLGETAFEAAMDVCEAAMRAFPRCLYAGIDLVVAQDLRKHAVIEMNAFGDLLHDSLYQGMDPYTLQIRRWLQHEHG